MKALVFVALVAAPFAALNALAFVLPEPIPANRAITNDLVPMIKCRGTAGIGGLGTGTRISPTQVLTASHVAEIGNCSINGEPVELEMQSVRLDIAIFKTLPRAGSWPVNCEPLRFGARYHAAGYARGAPLYRQEVFGTLHAAVPARILPKFGGTAMYVGRETFIPGMSGGPIVNDRGQLVAIVIGYNKALGVSYGRSLADTPLCGAPDA